MKEIELSERIQRRDPKAYKVLYETYAPYLYGTIIRYVANNETAKDLLHDTFLKIIDKSDTFSYREKGSLKAWITRIAINECMMYFRSTKKMKFLSLEERDDIDNDLIEDIDEVDIENIPIETIQEMIDSLPEGYRLVFNLFVIDGKSHKEISYLLGINEKSSSSQLARAKKKLAIKIKDWQRANEQKNNK